MKFTDIAAAPVRGFFASLARLVLWGSKSAGISHPTVATRIASAILAALDAPVSSSGV